MSEYEKLYAEISTAVGSEKIHRLLLLERANNQRHWGKRFRAGLSVKGYDYKEFRSRMQVVVDDMENEADRYDPPREA